MAEPDPVDWYVAGKILWTIQRRSRSRTLPANALMPERILLHPADRQRLLQRVSIELKLGPGREAIYGAQVEAKLDHPEHYCDLVYPGWEWVPVVFDPLPFAEPFPVELCPDGETLIRKHGLR